MTEDPNKKPNPIAPLLAPRGSGAPSLGSGMGGGEGMDVHLKKKTWTTRRIVMLAGGIAFISLLAWGFSTTTGGRRLNVDRERVTISEVQFAPFQEMISATGNVIPRTVVYLDAVEGGRIEEIFVLEGEMVVEGQPILRLSNPTLQLSLLNAETNRIEQINRLETTRFQVEQANMSMRQSLTDMEFQITRLRRDYDRNQELIAGQLISAQEFERTQDEYNYYVRRRNLTQQAYGQDSLRQVIQIAQMEGSIERMEENFVVIRQRQENLTLRAPVDGQLSQLNAELGELKGAGFRFGQVDMIDAVRVRAGVDEFHISRVHREQTAITLPIAGVEYDMIVWRVFPEVQNGRFEVDLDFVGQEPPGIRRGQTVRFKLEMSDPSDAIVVPLGGFYQTTGGNWIYVVDPSGEFAEKRAIRLGRKNLQVYEVLEGLLEGESVVTSSYDTFNEADRLVFR